jgi:hypothetical protein
MQNRPFAFGPIDLTTALGTNLLNPGTTTGGVNCTSTPYDKLKVILFRLRAVNRTSGVVKVSLWIGATGANAAGTGFLWQTASIPAYGFLEWGGRKELTTTQFLVGGADTATAVTLEGDGEIGVA